LGLRQARRIALEVLREAEQRRSASAEEEAKQGIQPENERNAMQHWIRITPLDDDNYFATRQTGLSGVADTPEQSLAEMRMYLSKQKRQMEHLIEDDITTRRYHDALLTRLAAKLAALNDLEAREGTEQEQERTDYTHEEGVVEYESAVPGKTLASNLRVGPPQATTEAAQDVSESVEITADGHLVKIGEVVYCVYLFHRGWIVTGVAVCPENLPMVPTLYSSQTAAETAARTALDAQARQEGGK